MSILKQRVDHSPKDLKVNHFSPTPPSSTVLMAVSAHVFNMYDLVWELGQAEAQLNFLHVLSEWSGGRVLSALLIAP